MRHKTTTGPWKTDGHGIVTGGPDFCTSICETPVILWRTGHGGKGFKHQVKQIEQAQANARLIASAPDLLEALQDMIKYLDNNGKETDVSEYARQAVAKAKGAS